MEDCESDMDIDLAGKMLTSWLSCVRCFFDVCVLSLSMVACVRCGT